VVKAEDPQLSGCGFKSQHHILDGVSDGKKRNKGIQMGHNKKNTKKNIIQFPFHGARKRLENKTCKTA
jgi:hypothetical protein